MRPPSDARALARRLERAVRAELRADPALAAEHRRLRKALPTAWTIVPVIAVFLAAFVLAPLALLLAVGQAREVTVWLGWQALATALALFAAASAHAGVKAARDRYAPLPLPHPLLLDQTLAGARRFVAWSSLLLLYLAALSVVAASAGAPVDGAFAGRMAGAAALSALGVYLLGVAAFRWLGQDAAAGGGCAALLVVAALIALCVGGEGHLGLNLWLSGKGWLARVTPVAWAPEGLLPGSSALWVAPLAVIALLHGRTLAALRRRPWARPVEPVRARAPEAPAPEALLAAVSGGAWLAADGDPRPGLVERAVDAALHPRERLLARFAHLGGRVTRPCAIGLAGFALTLVLIPLLPRDFTPLALAPLGLGALVALEAQLLGQWALRVSARVGARSIPRHAFFPVARRDLLRVRLKVAAVRAAAFLGPAVVLSPALGLSLGWAPLESAAVAAKLAAVYVGVLPALLVANFHGLVFVEPRWWRSLLLVGAGGTWLVACAVGAGLLLANPLPTLSDLAAGGEVSLRSQLAVGGGALLAALGWGPYLVYPWVYARSDLVRATPAVGQPPGDRR